MILIYIAFSRNATALLAVGGRSDFDRFRALPRAVTVQRIMSLRAACPHGSDLPATPCVYLGWSHRRLERRATDFLGTPCGTARPAAVMPAACPFLMVTVLLFSLDG